MCVFSMIVNNTMGIIVDIIIKLIPIRSSSVLYAHIKTGSLSFNV